MEKSKNLQAFLDMIAVSELGYEVIGGSDNGYNVLVGSTPDNILLFGSYDDHPRIHNVSLNSDAAGRYQIMSKTFDGYNDRAWKDGTFSPEMQDMYAITLIKECRALDAINQGAIEYAVPMVASRWASLPGNSYGQHKQIIHDLLSWYMEAGGKLWSV